MKASEVVNKYANGERNFQGVSLRGLSFKGKDLSGADFSGADIRGTNFTGANLVGANFRNAKAGLQRHWWIFILIVSFLVVIFSSYWTGILGAFFFFFYTLEADYSNTQATIATLVYLISILAFIIATISQGLVAGLSTIALLVALAISAGVFGLKGSVVGAVAVTFAGGGAVLGAVVVAVIAALSRSRAVLGVIVVAVIVAGSIARAVAQLEEREVVVAVAVAVGFTLVLAYISWRAMKGDPRDAWIRAFAIAFAAIKGTNFYQANLTDADFTEAKLNSTDLREAILIRTCWRDVTELDRVRPGYSYLNKPYIQKLLVTGNGKDQNFDRQDLRGVNLQGANLENASFIDTDLSQANLSHANLFEAKLVQTNLDLANLSNACLTGAYIEDWGITRRTKLGGVDCRYVYLQLPTRSDRDPNRMPPPEQGDFGKHDFNIFITSVLDTLDLYHREDINAGIAVTVLKGLTNQHDVQFEMVGLEKRGNDQFVIKLKVFGSTSRSQIQREYYARYEQTLPLYDPQKLMPDTDVVVEKIIEEMKNNPGTHIESLHNEGIVITGGNVNMSNRNINTGGGNYNESIGGDYIEGNKEK